MKPCDASLAAGVMKAVGAGMGTFGLGTGTFLELGFGAGIGFWTLAAVEAGNEVVGFAITAFCLNSMRAS